MNQHFDIVEILVSKGTQSDSCAKKTTSHFVPGDKSKYRKVRDKVDLEVIYKGNPISYLKSFGKLNCSLCMKDRLAILATQGDKGKRKRMVNSNTELYGAYMNNTKIHRSINHNPSTNEGQRSQEMGTELTIYPQ